MRNKFPLKKACFVWIGLLIAPLGMTQSYAAAPDSFARTKAIVNALDAIEGIEPSVPEETSVSDTPQKPSKETNQKKVNIKGEVRAALGVESDGDLVFTRANGNLTERDFRVLDFNALDRGQNTFDPAIYSRLKMTADAPLNRFVDMHLNVSVDPWSFTGKSQRFTTTGIGGDTATVQYLVWGNTGYAINQNVNTLVNGDILTMREVKLNGNTIPASSFGTVFGNTFNIPDLKVEYTFQPIREFWFDVKPEEDVLLRIFPMALGDQALTSDDPLKLSNNSMYWAESPWLWSWQKGNFNSGVPSFTQGQWDRSLAFSTRDSDLQRLTALRGATIKINPDEDNSLQATIASPKTLWQEYSEINALPASVRMKHYVNDHAYIGSTNNMHLGFNEGSLDASNYVGSIDGGIVPVSWLMINGQYSGSKSTYDKTSDFKSEKEGSAYYVSLTSTSNTDEMIRKDYFGLQPAQKADNFYKTRLYFSRMDRGFESTLANYHDTRQDSFWARHMTFYPNTYRNMPGVKPTSSEDDLEPFAIGNGIDYGRNVVGWRADKNLMEGRLKGLLDFRRVMDNHEHHIETVARTQWSLQATDKLLTKAMYMWHAVPQTTEDLDPFVYDHTTGRYLQNYSIDGSKDPSLKTFSWGARYELTPWANINGVWEYTNDFTLGANNFPGELFRNVAFITTTNGFRDPVSQVYGPFPKPSYEYHNIFKTGLELIPTEQWHIYLDYTRNPNKFAGNIDDNMNHFGIETSYLASKNIGFFARYTYSKWYDLNELFSAGNPLHYRSYHNIFLETRMMLPADGLLSLQYGVGPSYNTEISSVDPNLSYYASPALETQHLFRLVYDKKF